ncbi:MAG: ChbG/HpnK family deacetylase [Legionellales bacterium]
MNEFKTIMLCADDFGFTPGISHGILKLVRMQRLSAVSCMVNTADFIPYAGELLDLKDQVQIGLHFNLTDGPLLSDPSKQGFGLIELLMKTHLRLINPTVIAQEFNAQLDKFIQIMGFLPDFIDGHLHVHQFPRIRQVILDIYEQRLRSKRTPVRATYPAISLKPYQLKARILALTGGRALQHCLEQRDIPHNRYFSGIYDFSCGVPYRTLFRQWLALAPSNTLIMCHPGDGIGITDGIAPARPIELDYLLSDDLLRDCHEFRVVLALPSDRPRALKQ